MSTNPGSRFGVGARLGQGGSAIVRAAVDHWNADRPVVLKLLRADRGELAPALRREFALLFRLRHPHIAQVLGLYYPDPKERLDEQAMAGAPVLVIEQVGGSASNEWARDRDPRLIADVGLQLCAALAALHALGIHHGDVKPGNVLVMDGPSEPFAKLIDFGLAARGPGKVAAGTPRFMAPEALAGEVDRPADLYGLGATLAALLRPEGLREPLGSPLNAPALSEAIRALTAADPATRIDAVAAFELLLPEASDAGRRRALELRDGSREAAAVVGRDGFLERVEAMSRSQGGGSMVLALSGPPGSGRSAALASALGTLVGAGLRTAAVRRAADGSLAPLRAALGDFGVALDLPPVRPDDLRASRYNQFQTAVTALEKVAARGPIALFFDDVPADSPLAEFAAFLARLGARGPRVLWLTAGDSAAADVPTFVLEPLNVSQIAELLHLSRPLRRDDDSIARAVHRAAAGHAGDSVSLIAAHPGDALARAARDGTLEIPGATDEARRTRVMALADDERQLVAALSTIGRAVPRRIVEVGLEGSSAGKGAALDRLLLAGWLLSSEGETGAEISVATVGLGEAARRATEARGLELALRMLAQPELTISLAATRGRLLVDSARRNPGGVDADRACRAAGPLLLSGAELAVTELRLADAVQALELALTTPLPDPGRSAAQRELARLLVAVGHGERALSLLGPLADADPAARRGQVETLLTLGRYADAAAAAKVGAPSSSPLDDTLAALRARALMLAGRHEEARAVGEAALNAAPAGKAAARLHNTLGMVAYFLGERDRARHLLEQALALAKASADPADLDAARGNLALVLHKSRELDQAEALYRDSLAAAQERGDLPKRATRLTNLATLQQDQGRIDEALASYDEALVVTRLIDGRRDAVRVALNLSNLLVWLGDAGRAAPLVKAACADAISLGMHTEHGYLELVAAELELLRGDPRAAAAALARARPVFTELTAGMAGCDTVAAEIALFQRDNSEALAQASRAVVAAEASSHKDTARQARFFGALAALDLPPNADRENQARADLERVVADAEASSDPDFGWLASSALVRLHERRGRRIEAELHRAAAQRLYQKARGRLSSRYENSYTDVWYRRPLSLELSARRGDAEQQGAADPRTVDRLLAINREMASDRDPERLLERIIDAAIALSGAERGVLVLRGDDPAVGAMLASGSASTPVSGAASGAPTNDTGELNVRAARNFDRTSLAAEELEISRSIALQAIRSAMPVSSLDALGDDRFSAFQSVHVLKLRSILCLPLRSPDGILGALYLDHRHRTSAFTEADVAMLSAFGDQAAIALANARLLSALSTRSRELEKSRLEIEALNQRLERELRAQTDAVEQLRRGPNTPRRAIDAAADEDIAARHQMIGKSRGIREVCRIIERVADKEVTVAIRGESGTGKELVARAIHAASGRKGTFVSLNCGAIPAELLESELFGHERGAFTGAVRQKPGLFEVAQGGTVFLDEIGDMPLAMQVKLLRVLQQKELRRVGGTEVIAIDARVVTATHRDLDGMVRDGRFREDLWYRLNVVEVVVPPLRERREDIPALASHFVAIRGGKTPPALGRTALAALIDYDWPGNVRELENELMRALALADDEIDLDVLSDKLRRGFVGAPTSEGDPGRLREAVGDFEKDRIVATLAAHGGKVAAAARALGLTRAGLYKKMARYGIDPRRD